MTGRARSSIWTRPWGNESDYGKDLFSRDDYLLAMRDNEHVELHEVSGFASDDLVEAFCEADAIAKGTRCKNYMFSISLNPPQGVKASTEAFEQAAIRIEEKLGFSCIFER